MKSVSRNNHWSGMESLEARQLLSVLDVAITTALPLDTADNTPSLAGTVSDVTADVQVALMQGATTIGTWNATEDGTGGWQFTVPGDAALADGQYDIVVSASANGGADTGGITSPAGLIVDTTAPAVTVNTLTTNVVSPALSGSVDDAAATVSVHVDGADYAAVNNGDGTWSLAAGQIANLAEGTYDVTATATDAVGNSATDATTNELTVDLTAPVVTTTTIVSNNTRPALAGMVDDPTATVEVTVHGHTYTAVNAGDGTWSIAQGVIAALPNGVQKLTVVATDPAGNTDTDATAYLVVDATGPAVTVNKLVTTDTTPALSGTVSDNFADVLVTVDGHSHAAVNNGDGTWTLPDNSMAALGAGVYSVTVVATDALGNTRTVTRAGALSIASTVNVTLGAGVYSLTYSDADGTQVTMSAGRGSLIASFTGVDATVMGTGKSRTVTANGGVRSLAINVAQDTASLTFRTGKGGDAMTTINSITGSGILGKLVGANVAVADSGIDMLGRIQSLNVQRIEADVTMHAATLPTRGITIIADVIKNCAIQAAYVRTLSVANSFENAQVTATKIDVATLYNVVADNDGVSFGLTTTVLGKLSVRQGRTTLFWNRDFTNGILDFAVTLS